jgi:hypothetical protein
VPYNLLLYLEHCAKILAYRHRCPSIYREVCLGVIYYRIYTHLIIKGIVVDFILLSMFEEADLNKNSYIVLLYRHILTLESIDRHISISDFYTINSKGLIMDLKNSAKLFSVSGIKSYLTCHGSLQNLNRYSYIIRRALIDEATKKFIV